jgi:uncharacterized protein YecA (UPF0149 family)
MASFIHPCLSCESVAKELQSWHKDEKVHKPAQPEVTEVEEEELGSFPPHESALSHAELPAQTCTKPQPIRVPPQPARNAQCPCKSGLKYKRCCLAKALIRKAA